VRSRETRPVAPRHTFSEDEAGSQKAGLARLGSQRVHVLRLERKTMDEIARLNIELENVRATVAVYAANFIAYSDRLA